MKLVEKLAAQAMDRAQEQMLQNPFAGAGPDLSLASAHHYAGFIEGFRACRELAAKEVNTPSVWHAVCCRVTMESRSSNILELGESEAP